MYTPVPRTGYVKEEQEEDDYSPLSITAEELYNWRHNVDGELQRLTQENQRLQNKVSELSQAHDDLASRPVPQADSKTPIPSVSSFDGTAKALPDFLFRMQNQLRCLPSATTDMRKCAIVMGQLTGTAAAYVRQKTMQNGGIYPFTNATELLSLLDKRFRDNVAELAAQERLEGMYQRGSVEKHNAKFTELFVVCQELYTEAGIIRCYVNHLQPSIQKFVRQMQPSTLEEAMRAARTAEMSERSEAAAARALQNRWPQRQHEVLNPMPTQRFPQICWNCGKEGHRHENCRAPKATNPKFPYRPPRFTPSSNHQAPPAVDQSKK